MTTAQRMLSGLAWARVLPACFACIALSVGGCVSRSGPSEELRAPRVLVAPYHQGAGGQADVLWAVAPLRNESGVSVVDPLDLSDRLAYQVHQVRGVTTLPLNRTIAVMQALQIASIDTPAQVRSVLDALGADALLIGSITSYDPYDPPKLGLSLALFVKPGAMGVPSEPTATTLDPVTIGIAPTDAPVDLGSWSQRPVSVAAEHLDAASHEVQMAVRSFAEGRFDTVSALGWRRYLSSMPLYADFATHRLTERLLESERLRLIRQLASGAEERPPGQ